jgi:ubiquinone/menaquinone biosynthesis C-methylase UbiE
MLSQMLDNAIDKSAEARRYYDRIGASSDQDLRIEGGLYGYLRRFANILIGVRGPMVLEVGAGGGRFSRGLAARGFHVIATDLSRGMLQNIVDGLRDVPLVVADAHYLPFKDGSFDSIFSCDVLEHLHNPREAVREQERVCKPMGTIQAIVPNRYCPYYWKNLLRERYWWQYRTSPIHRRKSLKELARLFGDQGLELCRLETFLLVPSRAKGTLFSVLRRAEGAMERFRPIRLFLGLNYACAVRKETPRPMHPMRQPYEPGRTGQGLRPKVPAALLQERSRVLPSQRCPNSTPDA